MGFVTLSSNTCYDSRIYHLIFITESCTTSHSPTHKRTSSFEGLHDIQTDTDSLFAMTVGKDVEMFTKLGIIVDFDGTLSYLAKTPGN